MAVIGTFGSYTAARMGIYASQSSLNVTGNNISNINTTGYTRQRADLVSLYSSGSARYRNSFNLDIGYGVKVDSVSQLRDPYLDILYRDEQASVGFYETKVKGLQQLSNVLDEVGKGKGEFGILEAQFNDFLQQLQNLNNQVGSKEYDTTVRSSAESLVKMFNTYAESLTRVKDNQMADLQGDVTKVNTILTQIRDLNEQIREANIFHNNALELKDQRNVLIDKLSSYMKIEVQYTMEPLDEFSEVEKLSITLAGSGNPPTYLVNGIYGSQLTMPEQIEMRNPEYDPEDKKGMQYIGIGTDRDAKPPKVVLTDDIHQALRNADGDPVANNLTNRELIEGAGNVDPNTVYDPTYVPGMQYLDKDGNPTDDITQAGIVDNAVKSSDKNHLWMRLEPLMDARGRYIKDEYNRDIKEFVELGDNDLYGSLQAKRELLTEEGEFASKDDLKFDPDANIKRGIPYYQRALDALARKFADEFNKANTGVDANGNPNYEKVFLGYQTVKGADGIERYDLDPAKCTLAAPNGGEEQLMVDHLMAAGYTEAEAKDYLVRTDLSDLPENLQTELKALQNKHLTQRGCGNELLGGGVLFSNHGDGDNPEGITAANISISNSWATGAVRILNTKVVNGLDHTTADDNIYHMIELMGEQLEYKPDDIGDIVGATASDGKAYFTGSFQQRLADINTILASDQQTSTVQYTAFSLTSLTLDNNRQSVSGVDLNEEATNMMMYQKSYAAACQLMTVLDSMLDKLINGTI